MSSDQASFASATRRAPGRAWRTAIMRSMSPLPPSFNFSSSSWGTLAAFAAMLSGVPRLSV